MPGLDSKEHCPDFLNAGLFVCVTTKSPLRHYSPRIFSQKFLEYSAPESNLSKELENSVQVHSNLSYIPVKFEIRTSNNL